MKFLFLKCNEIKLNCKFRILERFEDVTLHVPCEHGEAEFFKVVNGVLDAHNNRMPGVIVECGAYKGGSTCKLSIIAKYLQRRLMTFDSFQGLPEDVLYHQSNGKEVPFFRGNYASDYAAFMESVRKFGEIEATTVVPGWFDQTLGHLQAKNILVAFLDVDLVSSTQTCLKVLWPKIVPGGYLFSHDGHLAEVRNVFQDKHFWRAEFGEDLPHVHGLGQEKLIFARKHD